MQELLDPVLLPDAVHVGDLVLGDRREVEVHLNEIKLINIYFDSIEYFFHPIFLNFSQTYNNGINSYTYIIHKN